MSLTFDLSSHPHFFSAVLAPGYLAISVTVAINKALKPNALNGDVKKHA